MTEPHNNPKRIYVQIIKSSYQTRIIDLENKIAEEKKKLECHKESWLNFSFDVITCTDSNAVTDLEDREKILTFFHDHIGLWNIQNYVPGLFTNKDNITYLCDIHKLDCPRWYIDKYCSYYVPSLRLRNEK